MTNTATRVQDHAPERTNDKLEAEAKERIRYFAHEGRSRIGERLRELDRESDIERAIEVEAPLMMLTGIALGSRVHKGFFAIPVFAASMVLLHSFHGWYPMIPLFRKLGLRTTREINDERQQLLILKEQAGAA